MAFDAEKIVEICIPALVAAGSAAVATLNIGRRMGKQDSTSESTDRRLQALEAWMRWQNEQLANILHHMGRRTTPPPVLDER